MRQRRASFFLPLLLPILISGVVARDRQVHYPKPPSARLKEIAQALSDAKREQYPFDRLPAADAFFVRISERQYILGADNLLKDTAALHRNPFVFVTTPEGLYGRSLLEIFEEVGYEAENVLGRQLGKEMVAVVFRYPDGVAISDVRDGRLPDVWDDRVYVPTWDNVFELFLRLARKDAAAVKVAAAQPVTRVLSLSDVELAFVIGFPDEGRRRVSCVPYGGLKAAGGADWVYRRLLESQLSVFEHFRGNGRTQNELLDPDGAQPERGLLEYVGPNMKIKDLAEVAVVDLGRVTAEVKYNR